MFLYHLLPEWRILWSDAHFLWHYSASCDFRPMKICLIGELKSWFCSFSNLCIKFKVINTDRWQSHHTPLFRCLALLCGCPSINLVGKPALNSRPSILCVSVDFHEIFGLAVIPSNKPLYKWKFKQIDKRKKNCSHCWNQIISTWSMDNMTPHWRHRRV